MAVNDLARAVALKALEADVAARLCLGEGPEAIRADLLEQGFPPEIVDHVFAACERSRPVSRTRTLVAAGLVALLLIGLPTAGAVCGVWAAVAATGPWPLTIPLGALAGFALGLALAFPAAKALSTWSTDGSIADDEGYD
jgi:hypothetical protein